MILFLERECLPAREVEDVAALPPASFEFVELLARRWPRHDIWLRS
jgi:hypothetical protein